MLQPAVSVIIISWNNATHLLRCLGALKNETYKNFEVIIVDNGSNNNPMNNIQQGGLNMRMERLQENMGFTIANNLGVHLAQGRWLALLNADAYPEPDWLERLVQATEENPEFSFFSSRQIQANDRHLLDGAGDVYHVSGIAWRRHYNRPAEHLALQPEEVFSACGAAALYLREDFLQVGGFDEDYFSYFEDVDLGFRLRLLGKKCLYVPQAVVYHIGSASTGKRGDFSVYYGYRNLIWTFVKNMPSPLIWLYLPLHIGTLLFFAVYLTFRGQGKAIWGAIFDAVLGLQKTFAKRSVIQQNFITGPADLLSIMSTGWLEPYLEFMRRNRRK